jgi:3-phenylpropionate/trans-cinnamate dioxygenase ferredoxin reductase subunit
VIREKTGLKRLVGKDGHVVAAELSDGTTIDVDFVVVGIGVVPLDRLAKEAGLAVANGIVVDAHVRSSDPNIYAVGDCAVLPWQGGLIRLESVQNAIDQAEAAAAIIAGGTAPYEPKPWFWSDQYDVKLQIAGFNAGYDATVLRHGAREGSASVWYFKAGQLVAVDAINDARAYVTGKKLIDAGINPDRALLADPDVDLKTLLG